MMGVVKSPKDTYGILEHHSLGIALADTLGLDTIGANGLFLTTFDAAFAACWSLSMVRATRRGMQHTQTAGLGSFLRVSAGP